MSISIQKHYMDMIILYLLSDLHLVGIYWFRLVEIRLYGFGRLLVGESLPASLRLWKG